METSMVHKRVMINCCATNGLLLMKSSIGFDGQ